MTTSRAEPLTAFFCSLPAAEGFYRFFVRLFTKLPQSVLLYCGESKVLESTAD
jgi:hypothetical protein